MSKGKVLLILKLHDERNDVDDVASEIDEPSRNRAIHEVLRKYLGAGDAKSDELLTEVDLDAGTMRLVAEGEKEFADVLHPVPTGATHYRLGLRGSGDPEDHHEIIGVGFSNAGGHRHGLTIGTIPKEEP